MKCESATHMSGLVEAKYVVGVGLTLCRCRNLPHCRNCRPLTALRSWLIAIVRDDLSVRHNLLDPSPSLPITGHLVPTPLANPGASTCHPGPWDPRW